MKNLKGITLTSLVITVIVMVILAGIALLFSVGEEGIIERANESKRRTELVEFKEKLSMEYMAIKNDPNNKDKLITKKFELLQGKMGFNANFIGSGGMIIKYDENIFLTLLENGTIIDGKKVELNIADGSIDIKANGYTQGEENFVEYNGDYLITGNTKEYGVRIIEEGNYNITIKDLTIDMTSINFGCPINLNAKNKDTNLNVKLYIEGKNNIIGGKHSSGIRFVTSFPNINKEKSGSTLTIQGNGEIYVKGGDYASAIGGGYSTLSGTVANIVIESGNITAVGGSSGCGIGGGYYASVNNIIINGGNLNLSSANGAGIGAWNGILNNLVINGGNITSDKVIRGKTGSGKIIINGGTINLNKTWSVDAVIGEGTEGIIINGGVINIYSERGVGIGNTAVLPFKLEINDGEINIDDRICSTPVNLTSGNWYLTKFKIGDLTKQLKVDKVQTNNNIEYETENLYTMKDGYLYMFLPEGEVTVSVTIAGTTYTGTVTVTPENTEVFVLN